MLFRSANDALATTGAGANIAAADDVSEQISNVKNALSDLGLTIVNGKLCAVYNT